MKNLERILVAVDLNDDSLAALEYGLTLGLLFNSHIKCIYTKNDSKPDLVVAGDQATAGPQSLKSEYQYSEATDSEDLEVLDRLVTVISERLGADDLQIETEIVNGPILKSILDQSDHWMADMIVVGLTSFADQIDHTSISQTIVEGSATNVLLVPLGSRYHYLERIGVLTDFKFGEINMILTILEIARANQLQITLLCMLPDNCENALMKKQLKIYHRLFDQDIRKGILSFKFFTKEKPELAQVLSEEDGFDLFVTRKENWPLTQRLELSELARKARIPELIWK